MDSFTARNEEPKNLYHFETIPFILRHHVIIELSSLSNS